MSKVCARCHRGLSQLPPKRQRQTDYGVVCDYCYNHYYKPQKVCEGCGVEKPLVFERTTLVNNPYYQGKTLLCVACYGAVRGKNQTCKGCRYPRLLNAHGFCARCANGQTHQCQQCHKPMSLGRVKYCFICSKKRAYEKTINKSIYLLKNEEMRQIYHQFATYLLKNYNNINTLKEFTKYLRFFIECEEQWGCIPDYTVLVTHFKPNGLRSYLRLLRWLIKTERISVDDDIKALISEQERIHALLAKLNPMPVVIEHYYHTLQMQLNEGISIKTVRLALQPVVDIWIFQTLGTEDIPNAAVLERYLLQKAGQYNSLLKFVTFLKNNYNPNLVVPRPKKTAVLEQQTKSMIAQRKVAEKTLATLLQKPKDERTKRDEWCWLRNAMLLYQHKAISAKTTRQMILISIDDTGEYGLYQLGEQKYWLANYNYYQ